MVGLLQVAFGGCPRPDQFFVGRLDDLEYADHNACVQSQTVDSIALADLGTVGYDPFCSTDVAGYLHYMPGLGRVLLGDGGEEYLFQFLLHLRPERVAAFTTGQRAAVARLLEHVRDTRSEAIQFDREDLAAMLGLLRGPDAEPGAAADGGA